MLLVHQDECGKHRHCPTKQLPDPRVCGMRVHFERFGYREASNQRQCGEFDLMKRLMILASKVKTSSTILKEKLFEDTLGLPWQRNET